MSGLPVREHLAGLLRVRMLRAKALFKDGERERKILSCLRSFSFDMEQLTQAAQTSGRTGNQLGYSIPTTRKAMRGLRI